MPTSPSEAFGAALREMRAERGLSQEAAALASDVDRSYFGKLERGSKVPTLTTVWKIASAFDVQPSELLSRAEKLLR
jgi:XRE family transcriptional regulator, regulator of sulfur utilization